MLKYRFTLRNETKNCYRFETGSRDTDDLITLYLKKVDVDKAGIDTKKGITVAVTQDA